MSNNRGNQSSYEQWNRRLINLYWLTNAIILVVELIVAVIYYSPVNAETLPENSPRLSAYMYNFVFIPSCLILLLTAGCEIAVRWLGFRRKYLQPYAITFTCVAFCAVLLIVHYSVTVIFVVYIMPLFFSLVYNDKRVLSFTFLFSLLVFTVIYFWYFRHADLPFLNIHPADTPASLAILVISYLICLTILNRFEDMITIMMQAERSANEAETAKRRAELVAEARTRFLANMSHEIRTPMNGIIGLTELAIDETGISERQKDYLAKIKSSADGLLAIINDILDIAKIDSGEASLEKIPFSLHKVLTECESIISHKAAKKGLRLYFYDETGLENKIIGDPTKLRQAILNFLSNAVKFTKEGSVTLVAKRLGQDSGSHAVKICFEISDTGIGMTKEQCEKVFEPFHQADDSITRSYGGTGLGLSITKSIIEMMGGEITVKSIPDIGSRFSFVLDLELSDEKNAADVDGLSSAPRPIFDGDILICEDDSINQQVAVQNLEKLGFRVVLSDNGKAGVEAALKRERENKPFDMIFMDINMPVMDGLQAVRELVGNNVKTPIIAMTAVAMKHDIEKYLDAGMAGYLCKPFKIQELRSCLMGHLTPVDFVSDTEAEPAPCTPTACLEDSASIDIPVGVARFAGDKEAYARALETFSKKYSDTPSAIERAIGNKDFALAERTAHTEKGAAAIIGANRLSDILAALEESLKRSGSYYNCAVMNEYKEEHSKVMRCISGFKP